MKLADVLREPCIVPEIKGKKKEAIIAELVGVLEQAGLIKDTAEAVKVVMERERLGSTGIGNGVAIPHGKLKGLTAIVCSFGISREGVDFEAVDMNPVQIFFLVLAPEDAPGLHLRALSRITTVLRDQSFREKVVTLTSVHDIYRSILEEDDKI